MGDHHFGHGVLGSRQTCRGPPHWFSNQPRYRRARICPRSTRLLVGLHLWLYPAVRLTPVGDTPTGARRSRRVATDRRVSVRSGRPVHGWHQRSGSDGRTAVAIPLDPHAVAGEEKEAAALVVDPGRRPRLHMVGRVSLP